MRCKPEAEDADDVKDLNAEPWMLELLSLNPEYVHWGPHEDYMWKPGANEPDPEPPKNIVEAICNPKKGSGWDTRVLLKRWSEMWALDELNECVNFYFSVERSARRCDACGQSGQNPETKRIADGFYDHSSPTGKGWHASITQDEVDALWEQGCLTHDFRGGKPTADAVNAWQRGKVIGHDAINRWILVETRAKRLGVYGQCSECQGRGDIFTEPSAHVSLTLWILHPRKGCSRGVEVERVERDELPSIFAWLKEAAERNAQRFALIP